MQPKKLGRARRAIGGAAKAFGLATVFGIAAVGGLYIHLALPVPRAFAVAQVNAILDGTFKGKIVIHRIGVVHYDHIAGVEAEVLSPEGERVAYAAGVSAKIGTVALVKSLVSGPRMVVPITEIHVEAAEVVLEDNQAGDIGLVRAFDSATPDTGAPSRGTEVTLSKITLDHAYVHGHLAAVPIINADLDDLHGALKTSPDTTDIDVSHLEITGRGIRGLNPHGTVMAHASLPGDPNAKTKVDARYEGLVGEIPVVADAKMDGKKVDAVVDVAETPAAAIMAIAPDAIHLGAPVTAHAEVHGELPHLKADLDAHVGSGGIKASADVILPDGDKKDLNLSAKLHLENIDIHQLESSAPASRLTADVDATVTSHPGGRLDGHFRLDNKVGSVAGQVIPAVLAEGDFTEASVKGKAQIAEIGAPTSITFDLHPKPKETKPSEVVFTSDTEVADIDHIQRIGKIGKGKARLTTSGKIDLEKSLIDASVLGDVYALNVQGFEVGRVHVTGSASGPLANPSFKTTVLTAPMRFAPYGFIGGVIKASGSPKEIDLDARVTGDDHTPTVDARAHLSTARGLALSKVAVDIERGPVKGTATIASIDTSGGKLSIRGISLEGLGDPVKASFSSAGGNINVTAQGKNVDLSKIALLAGKDEAIHGHADLDVEIKATRASANGHVNVEVRDLSALDLQGAGVKIALLLDGKHLNGTVSASLDKAGSLEIKTPDVAFDGALTDVHTWEKATGSADIDGHFDIGQLFERVPYAMRPIGYAGGQMTLSGRVARPLANYDPDVDLSVATQNLMAVGKIDLITNEDGTFKLGSTPWSVAGIDTEITTKLTGESGHTALSVKLHDKVGALADAEASADLPVHALINDSAHAVAKLEQLPLSLKIQIPTRSLQKLPSEVGAIPVRGDISGTVKFKGTLGAPELTAAIKVDHLAPKNTDTCKHDITAETTLSYDGKAGTLGLVLSSDRKRALIGVVEGSFDLQAALDKKPLAWDAKANLSLVHLPLDVVGTFIDQPIEGDANGEVTLEGLHHDANLHGKIDLTDLAFAKGKFPRGTVEVTAKGGTFSATTRLDQSDGHLALGASGGLTWGDALAPTFALDKPVVVSLDAKNFRASVAKPFTAEIFSEIDGRVDADMKLTVKDGGKDGTAEGSVALRDGVIDVPQIGERFHSIKAKIVMKPWGTVRLEGFSADAPTGNLTASADATLNGFNLKSANAKISIKQGQSIPISVEGVPMGRAFGEIAVKATMAADQKRLDIHVDVPTLRVDLPQSTGNSVQGLDPDKHVAVGYGSATGFNFLSLEKPVQARPPSALVIRAEVKMGQELEVKRDTTLDVFATGSTVIEISDKTHVSGQIRLVRGKLDLQGKIFTIDKGEVSFVGKNAADPMILATAYWDAPGNIRVYADFSGFVSQGKLALRSEPAMTQDEILALILFGSSDGSFGAQPAAGQGESDVAQGVGMAGGVVTQGVNKIISGVTTADISTRIDSSEANNPTPEVGVQITKTISARLGYKLGVPAPGDNPDRAELTVDWRFIRNWSVSAQVGDLGSTALDLVWRKRY